MFINILKYSKIYLNISECSKYIKYIKIPTTTKKSQIKTNLDAPDYKLSMF